MPIFQRSPYRLALDNTPRRIFGPRPMDEEEEAPVIPEMANKEMVSEPFAGQPPAEPKPGIGQKLGKLFGITRPPSERDEFGLEKPAIEKEGMGAKVLNYLLPLAVGAIGGVPFHALAAAHAGDRERQLERQKTFSDEQDKYNQAYAKLAKPLEPTSERQNWEYYRSLPGPEQTAYLNKLAASAGVGFVTPESGGPPTKIPLNPKEPREPSAQESVGRVRAYKQWLAGGKVGPRPSSPSQRDIDIYQGQDPKVLMKENYLLSGKR